MNINELSKQIYEQNKAAGWWNDPNRCIWTTIQLISTEVAEATEGERKNLMDDHLPHRKMGEAELADAQIRLLDLGGRWGVKIDELATANFPYGVSTIGAIHLGINKGITLMADQINKGAPYTDISFALWHAWSNLVLTINHAAFLLGYDIEAAMMEKLEYNKNRADHKRENRQKEHGKKF